MDSSDPLAESFQAWCDMSHDGGVWTLIMKFDDASEELRYNGLQWETHLLLNENDVTPNDDPYGHMAPMPSMKRTM